MHRLFIFTISLALAACGGGSGSSSAPEIPSGLDTKKLYLFHRLGGIEGIQNLKKKPWVTADPERLDTFWKCSLNALGKKLSGDVLETLTQEYIAREDLISGEINRSKYKQIISDVTAFKAALKNREKVDLNAAEGGLARCKQEFEQA